MADRCSASIVIGGTLPTEHLGEFIALIRDEGLAVDYDGPEFAPGDIVSGEPLMLCAHEVSWGTFNVLEPFCVTHNLAYSRWNGACSGVWGCGRSVYRGDAATREGKPMIDEYDVSEDDQILMGEQLARSLGSFEAILEHFAHADFTLPPLVVTPAACRQTETTARQA
jgi:hypothetical protein